MAICVNMEHVELNFYTYYVFFYLLRKYHSAGRDVFGRFLVWSGSTLSPPYIAYYGENTGINAMPCVNILCIIIQ